MKHPGKRPLSLGLCLCVLYVGYELARAATISLFTTQAAGLSGAMVAVAGFILSVASLALYGRGVEVLGATWTLIVSACGCCFIFIVGAVGLLHTSAEKNGVGVGTDRLWWALVIGMFAFREAYVTLVGTQIWALLSAELKLQGKEMSRHWFCLIQGVSCMSSALAGLSAGGIATTGGQVCLLLATALSLMAIATIVLFTCCRVHNHGASSTTSDERCSIQANGHSSEKPNGTTHAAVNGDISGGAQRQQQGKEGLVNGSTLKHTDGNDRHRDDNEVVKRRPEQWKNGGLWGVLRSSAMLFRRNPLLTALLAEAVVCQVLTATLNMSFNEAVRESQAGARAPDSSTRAAGFVGMSFAFIGLFSGALQLVILPWALVRVDPSFLLRTLPMVAGVAYMIVFLFPGFRTATAAFATTKILDYSIRGTALELVYQPLPDRERLLGKEAIATVGVRIGRTAAPVALYLCSAVIGGAPSQRILMILALVAASLWSLALGKVKVLEVTGPSTRHHAAGTTARPPQENEVSNEMRDCVTREGGRGCGGSSNGDDEFGSTGFEIVNIANESFHEGCSVDETVPKNKDL